MPNDSSVPSSEAQPVLYVHWTSDCEAVTDGAVVAHVDSLLAAFRKGELPEGISCGQEIVVNELRLRVLRAELLPEQLVFLYEDQSIGVNQHGKLAKWPRGFCDVLVIQLSTLVRGAARMDESGHPAKAPGSQSQDEAS